MFRIPTIGNAAPGRVTIGRRRAMLAGAQKEEVRFPWFGDEWETDLEGLYDECTR